MIEDTTNKSVFIRVSIVIPDCFGFVLHRWVIGKKKKEKKTRAILVKIFSDSLTVTKNLLKFASLPKWGS